MDDGTRLGPNQDARDSPPDEEAVSAEPVGDFTLGYAIPEATSPAWPFAWPIRILYLTLGVAGAIVGLLFNLEPDDDLVPVEWQNGQPLAWLTLATLPQVLWPIAPFLLASWLAMTFVCLSPLGVAPTPSAARWTRIGLWCGVALGVEYTLVVSAGLGEGELKETVHSLLWQGAIGGLGTFLGLLILHVLFRLARRSRAARRTLWAVTAAGVVGLSTVSWFRGLELVPGALIFSVVFAAPASAVAYGMMLWHFARAVAARPNFEEGDVGDRQRGLGLLPTAILLVAMHAVAWVVVRLLAGRAYARLPTQPPEHCFVATAAARSRRSRVSNHRQLATLRGLERAVATRHPLLHRVMRRLYNVVGPAVARRINSPARADVAHRLLRPAEWLARAIGPWR